MVIVGLVLGFIVGALCGILMGYRLRKKTVLDTLSMEEMNSWFARRAAPSCMNAETDDGRPCCICCGEAGPSPCQTCDAHLDDWEVCGWGCLPCSYVEPCSLHGTKS